VYDVVLMDVQMPEMDGEEATRRIRAQWPAAERPYIVGMTAHAMKGDREKYMDAGMQDYVTKPVRPQELATALQRCTALSARRLPLATPSGGVNLATLAAFESAVGEKARELIGLFGADASRLLSGVRQAVAVQDLDGLHRAAHALRGSSATFGAETLSMLCQELETLEGWSGAGDKVALLEREVDRVKAELERYGLVREKELDGE
jgi:HPt (histidine-containing phosphotransfer) domain-containing protein